MDVFVEEAQEHLNNLNQNLLKLETEPNNHDLINEIFRAAHTLKGMAGTMGFDNISRITHEMENVLQNLRNGKLSITTAIIDTLFDCFDVLEEGIKGILNGKSDVELQIDEIIDRLNTVSNEQKPCSTNKNNKKEVKNDFNEYELNVLKEAQKRGLKALKIDIRLKKDCLLKSARAFLIFKSLEKCGDIIKTVPSVEDIEDEKFDYEICLFLITDNSKDEIYQKIETISEIDELKISTIEIENKKQSNEFQQKKEINNHSNKLKTAKTVRVDIERLDNLMNLVSELIIIKTRIERIAKQNSRDAKELFDSIENLERTTTNLHDAVMKVRMVPIEQVFSRFPRMVRDLSKELGKKINLKIEGQETELDRTIIDEIGDPLIHLIRNSADHGIEPPMERLKNNKPQEGNIIIRAFHEGNNVVIEVEDDGRGIDLTKIEQKARDEGLIRNTDNLSRNEIINLLFKPGFSTAEKITDLSGRGVGLDVVKTKIESLGGSIEIDTYENNGTKFIIRLPLTLAIIQALLVDVGGEQYALPLSSIKETVNIKLSEINRIKNQEVVLFRGNVLPIIRLNKILDVNEKKEETDKELTVVIVVKGDKHLGLAVDTLIGQQEIVIKSLGKLLNHIKIISGATILGDGKVALIIDTNALG